MTARIVGVVLLVGLVVSVGLGCEATVPKKQYMSLEGMYQETQATNQTLERNLASANQDKSDMRAELERLRNQKWPEGVQPHMLNGNPAIRMDAALLYPSGNATLSGPGKAALQQVASTIRSEYPNAEIRVEGHTDTDPINRTKDKYDTNWDLGAKRANEVVMFLTKECGVDSKKIYGASYGQFRPISSNKASNRRVEIVVLPAPTGGPMVSTTRMTGTSEEK